MTENDDTADEETIARLRREHAEEVGKHAGQGELSFGRVVSLMLETILAGVIARELKGVDTDLVQAGQPPLAEVDRKHFQSFGVTLGLRLVDTLTPDEEDIRAMVQLITKAYVRMITKGGSDGAGAAGGPVEH